MDAQRFDSLARFLGRATVRRRLLTGLALSPFAGHLATRTAEAKKKHKKRKKKAKKPQPNEYGCLNAGQPCNGDSTQCCSGICEGKKPKKGEKDKSRCVAHDSSFCTAEKDICTTGVNVYCNTTNEQYKCGCVLTTGNAGFCGDFTEYSGADLCRSCSQDADCREEFGPGAACVVFGGEECGTYCPQTGGAACVPACPAP